MLFVAIGIILYTFTQFHSTTAIATSILIGIGILFCGGAMVHNVFVWQKEKTISLRQQMTMPLNISAISPPTPFMNTLNSTNLLNHSSLNHSSAAAMNHSINQSLAAAAAAAAANHHHSTTTNHSTTLPQFNHLSFNHSQLSQPNHLNHTHMSTFSRQTPVALHHMAQPGGQVPTIHAVNHHPQFTSSMSSQYVPTHGGGNGGSQQYVSTPGSQLTPMSNGSQLTPMSANHSHLSFNYPHLYHHSYTVRPPTGTPPTPRIGQPVMPPVIPTRDNTSSVSPMGQMPTIDVSTNAAGPNSPQSELSTLV